MNQTVQFHPSIDGQFLSDSGTCCWISDALAAPSLRSLSGDGKLRKEDTSGGRDAGAGVENCGKPEREKKKTFYIGTV